MNFQNFIFGLFPDYFKANDSYKQTQVGDNPNNPTGKGLLERYSEIFEDELDEGFLPFIDDFIDELAPSTVGADRLNYLAYTLGSPPDILNDDDYYRKLLGFMMTIYKLKGTALSYTIFFGILGYHVRVIEIDNVDFLYDIGILYDDVDDGDNPITYDLTCQPCSYYNLIISSLENDCENPQEFELLDQTTLDTIRAVICFLEPINAKLKSLINALRLCEEATLCVSDVIEWETRDYFNYDDGELHDDGELYDDYVIVDSGSETSGCEAGLIEGGIGFSIIEDTFIVD